MRVKSIGDAVMLRFGDPASAVAAVGRVFAGCADEPGFPLPRAGLHHGTAVPREGDWFGGTVNLAARVAGQAYGGQLLATAEVAASARGAGLTVIDSARCSCETWPSRSSCSTSRSARR